MSHTTLAILLAGFCAAFGYWPILADTIRDLRDRREPSVDVHYGADGRRETEPRLLPTGDN